MDAAFGYACLQRHCAIRCRCQFASRYLRDRGLSQKDRLDYLQTVLARFRERRDKRRLEELKNQARTAADHDAGRRILERLQNTPNP